MKKLLLLVAVIFSSQAAAQDATVISTPQHIVIDSKDNIFVTRQFGLVKISPNGTVTNLSDQGPRIGGMDRTWNDLIIDSKDNMYAHDGKVIYKIVVSADNKVTLTKFAGQDYGYEIKDGPLAAAGFNAIGLMTIDKKDNIYLTDSYDKIRETIGSNFVTDPYYLTDPAKKYLKYRARSYAVLRKISPGGMVTTLKTPDGKFILPNKPGGMAADADGNIIYSSYSFGRFIGKIDVATGAITLVAGQPYKREWCPVYTQGDVSRAEFVEPESLIVNRKGEILFTDQRINRVIRIAGGKVSTLAGGNVIDPCSQNIGGRSQEGYKDGAASAALFNFPKGLAYDSKGNLYIADMYNHAVRKLSPSGIVTTFAK